MTDVRCLETLRASGQCTRRPVPGTPTCKQHTRPLVWEGSSQDPGGYAWAYLVRELTHEAQAVYRNHYKGHRSMPAAYQVALAWDQGKAWAHEPGAVRLYLDSYENLGYKDALTMVETLGE